MNKNISVFANNTNERNLPNSSYGEICPPHFVDEFDVLKVILNSRKDNKTNRDNPHMDIVDYKYEPIDKYDKKGNRVTYMQTTLSFRDGTKTAVAASKEKADPFYGFYVCFAKHMANGNKINDEAEYWIEKRPKKLEKERIAKENAIAEEQRKLEREKKRREQNRVRLAAIRRKEAYDAAQFAAKKYGVPKDWVEK